MGYTYFDITRNIIDIVIQIFWIKKELLRNEQPINLVLQPFAISLLLL